MYSLLTKYRKVSKLWRGLPLCSQSNSSPTKFNMWFPKAFECISWQKCRQHRSCMGIFFFFQTARKKHKNVYHSYSHSSAHDAHPLPRWLHAIAQEAGKCSSSCISRKKREQVWWTISQFLTVSFPKYYTSYANIFSSCILGMAYSNMSSTI